jgi:hypothetical protein
MLAGFELVAVVMKNSIFWVVVESWLRNMPPSSYGL